MNFYQVHGHLSTNFRLSMMDKRKFVDKRSVVEQW